MLPQRPAPEACPLCGGALLAERRLPGRRGGALPASGERRERTLFAAVGKRRPPASTA